MFSEDLSIGSEWRIWDLHIHTPYSENYSGDMSTLVENAKGCEAKVLGINDYSTIKGYEEILQTDLGNYKYLFPIVELRMHNILTNRKGVAAGTRINFHLIFNNSDLLLSRIKTFLNSLECYNETGNSDLLGNIKDEKLNRITFDFDKVISKLNELDLRKDCLVWLPYDEYGGIDDIDPDDNFFKLHLINKADIIGSANKKQIDFFLWKDDRFSKENYEKWFDKPKPCLKGSDSHKSDDIFGRLKNENSEPIKKFCWIKSDPTFEGLKQILFEPENRIFIGKNPPKLEVLSLHPENFIDNLEVISKSNDNEWFDNIKIIPLNRDLVSIIGNKGTGKSALADIIGSVGNAHTKTYSFLNPQKFLSLRNCNKYSAKLKFLDNYENQKTFDNPEHITTLPSKVIYFSQSFVNELCENEDVSRLGSEIERVIFSHIPFEHRLKTQNLNELIDKKTSSIEKRIIDNRKKLDESNKEIVRLENFQKEEIKKKLDNSLAEKRRLYQEIQKQEPPIVAEPSEIEGKVIMDSANKNREEIEKFEKEQAKYKKHLTDLYENKFEVESIKNTITDFDRKYKELLEELSIKPVVIKYKIDIKNIIEMKTNYSQLNNTVEQINKEILDIEKNIGLNSNKISEIN